MTGNDLILKIEERISELLAIMKKHEGLTSYGCPKPENTKAFVEWNILRDTSGRLQRIL